MTKLRSKITATYVGLGIVLAASAGILSSARIESYFKQRLVDDLSRQADLIAFFLRNDSTLSFRQVDDRVRTISGIENLRITLIGADGTVLADSDVPGDRLSSVENHLARPEVQQALNGAVGVQTRHSATVGRDFLYVAKSVQKPFPGSFFRNMKFVRLSIPLEDVHAQVNSIRFNIILAGLIVLVLVSGISVFVSQRISKPMLHIARSLERIRSGDLDERINIKSNDEIGQVARAVNELLDKLKMDIAELEKLQRVRSEFLGNVSHELRTPIFAIQGFLETLLNGAINDPAVNRVFLEKAQAQAHGLNNLLADLINISQIESGEMKMSFRYFRVNEFLQGTARDFEATAEQQHIALRLDLKTAERDEVFGDRERLHQVMSNLVENAIRYNRTNGSVTISAVDRNGNIAVSVTDTGVGIASEHLPRIFERFYRVDKDRSREVGGTGLGLAIVKHIVEAHGSTVEVLSTPGKGSSFSFLLRKG